MRFHKLGYCEEITAGQRQSKQKKGTANGPYFDTAPIGQNPDPRGGPGTPHNYWEGERRRYKSYWRSYSPLLTRLSTWKPAFLASEIDSVLGELNRENTLRTGFLQAGQFVKGAAERGRRRVNLPPHTLQSPSQSSYS